MTDLFLGLDSSDPDDAKILDFFGAGSFVATQNSNYDQIEDAAREQGLLG